jgi:hypothetical protein
MTRYRDNLNAGQYAPPTPPDEATVADLQDQLRNLGQPTSGTKAELITRLEQAQQPAPAEDSE